MIRIKKYTYIVIVFTRKLHILVGNDDKDEFFNSHHSFIRDHISRNAIQRDADESVLIISITR